MRSPGLTVNGSDERLTRIQNNLDLPAVVRVYSARGIDQGDSVLDGQAAAGTYLCLESGRQLNVQTSGYEFPLQGAEGYGLSDVSPEIHPGRLAGGIGRCLEMRLIDYLDFH